MSAEEASSDFTKAIICTLELPERVLFLYLVTYLMTAKSSSLGGLGSLVSKSIEKPYSNRMEVCEESVENGDGYFYC